MRLCLPTARIWFLLGKRLMAGGEHICFSVKDELKAFAETPSCASLHIRAVLQDTFLLQASDKRVDNRVGGARDGCRTGLNAPTCVCTSKQ